MIYFRGAVSIETDLDVDSAAHELSSQFFGGAEFRPYPPQCKDGFRTLAVEVLGVQFVLAGAEQEDGVLQLQCSSRTLGRTSEIIDLSNHVAQILQSWPNAHCVQALPFPIADRT